MLNPAAENGSTRRVDHVAFRVDSLADLRSFEARLGSTRHDTVTHGTTWSLYFLDPEGNRLEIFADTPWYVEQPTRLPIDMGVDDDELVDATRHLVESLPQFGSYKEWGVDRRSRMTEPPTQGI